MFNTNPYNKIFSQNMNIIPRQFIANCTFQITHIKTAHKMKIDTWALHMCRLYIDDKVTLKI